MSKFKRWLIGIVSIFILVVIVALAVFWKDIQEIRGAMDYANTFDPDTIVENFRSLYKKYPSTSLHRSGPVYELPEKHRELPPTYVYEGETKVISNWIKRTDTTGLLVIKDGFIVFENYYDGNKKSTRTISMSVAKSFVSFFDRRGCKGRENS